MPCSCDPSAISFTVSQPLRDCAPEGSRAAAICPRCLTVTPAATGSEEPDFSRVSGAFPDGEAGVALALTLGLLESLATNRPRIETAIAHVERAGVDPLLTIDRLLDERDVEPAIDLERRRAQLESFLY